MRRGIKDNLLFAAVSFPTLLAFSPENARNFRCVGEKAFFPVEEEKLSQARQAPTVN
jgi:hypothetical protein